ncbi:MAG: LysR substrate-binding domain-containing protein, partial [Gammaproteobacteria bacterium]
RIDAGFGRLRFDDPQVRRDVLREERLVAALPLCHKLLGQDGALTLADLAREPLVVYPSAPRPSYADQVISLFRDRGFEPSIAHEARELQTAIGLVAAEVGIAVVPASVQRLRRDDVAYLELADADATSPIILSRRVNDRSRPTALLIRAILDAYRQWGWTAPVGLER